MNQISKSQPEVVKGYQKALEEKYPAEAPKKKERKRKFRVDLPTVVKYLVAGMAVRTIPQELEVDEGDFLDWYGKNLPQINVELRKQMAPKTMPVPDFLKRPDKE